MSGGFQTLGDWSDTGTEMAVVLACDALGRVLLQLRDDFKHIAKPGRWGMFGGHVEPEEAPIDAVVREFTEETGLTFLPENFIPFVRLVSDTGARHFIYRLTVPIEGRQIRLGEGAGFAFLGREQLHKFDLLPAARAPIDLHFAQIAS